MSYLEQFQKFVSDWMDENEVHDVYLVEQEGCYPTDWMSDDLFMDITRKFYDPLRFVTTLIPQYKQIEFKIYVMPSYMNRTYYAVVYEDVVVFEDSDKAWNFWFDGEEEFNRWVETTLETMKIKLGESKPLFSDIEVLG